MHAGKSFDFISRWKYRGRVFTREGENGGMRIPDWKGQSFAFCCCFLLPAGVSLLQIVVNVGPKLLQLVPEGVEAHLRSPVGEIRRKSTIVGRIIDVGNGNRRCVAGKLGNVEHVGTGVSSGDENTADGIAKAAHERAPA